MEKPITFTHKEKKIRKTFNPDSIYSPSQNVRVLFLSTPKEIFLISYGNSDINILCSYFLPINAAGYHEASSFQ